MKRNRIIVAVLVTMLMVTGCAVSNNDTKKKTDEKVSVKKQDKSKTKKKEAIPESQRNKRSQGRSIARTGNSGKSGSRNACCYGDFEYVYR